MNPDILTLCLVTHIGNQSIPSYLQFLELAIQGGVTLVQYRDKTNCFSSLRKTALTLKSFLNDLHIPFLINDHIELAADIDADGVHLGAMDGCPNAARHLLGPDKIIGVSVESYEQLNLLTNIDYIAASAVFHSQTKIDCKTIWGLAGLKKLTLQSKYPVLAIGGIIQSNTTEVIQHGAAGIAVVSALHKALNPKSAAQQLIQAIDQGKSNV